jgi:hypothetical protein
MAVISAGLAQVFATMVLQNTLKHLRFGWGLADTARARHVKWMSFMM